MGSSTGGSEKGSESGCALTVESAGLPNELFKCERQRGVKVTPRFGLPNWKESCQNLNEEGRGYSRFGGRSGEDWKFLSGHVELEISIDIQDVESIIPRETSEPPRVFLCLTYSGSALPSYSSVRSTVTPDER